MRLRAKQTDTTLLCDVFMCDHAVSRFLLACLSAFVYSCTYTCICIIYIYTYVDVHFQFRGGPLPTAFSLAEDLGHTPGGPIAALVVVELEDPQQRHLLHHLPGASRYHRPDGTGRGGGGGCDGTRENHHVTPKITTNL